MTDDPRTGKARERYQRRRQKRNMAEPTAAGGKSRRRQVRPADLRSIDWANLKFIRPLLLGVAGLVFMGALVLVFGLLKDDPPVPHANAIWIGGNWTYSTHSDDAMNTLIRRLNNNRIGTVYARVSELNYDGTWTGRATEQNRFAEVQDEVVAFAAQFKRLAPEKQIYGTIYFRVDIGQEDNYRLDNETIQGVVADFAERVVNTMGFDGVLLVVEPVWNDNSADYLDLLRLVRASIGDSARLAVAVPPDWTPDVDGVPQTALIASGTVWDDEFKQRVALVGVDEIIVQAYNSYLGQPDDFAAWVAHQTETYARAIGDLGIRTRVMIGVPAYASLLPAHDERIENIENALIGVREGLARVEADELAAVVQGVAIYAEWGMDEILWEQYRAGWLRN